MNIFEMVKEAVTVRQAAEYYGLKINRNHMICCMFHNDRHPSMKLNEDYFYCFSCGASGDVIALVAELFGIDQYEAAKKLVADFGLNPDKPPVAAALKRTKYQKVKAFRQDEQFCQNVLCDYLHLLETWGKKYAPKKPEDELDDRFVEACQMHSYIENLADILTVGDVETRIKTVAILLRDGTVSELSKRLDRLKAEEKRHKKEQQSI